MLFRAAMGVAAVILAAGCGAHTVRLDSEPRGARVSLNGKPLGFTPVDFEQSGGGTHEAFIFKFEKDGYETRIEEHHKSEFCIRHLVDLRPYYIAVLKKKQPRT